MPGKIILIISIVFWGLSAVHAQDIKVRGSFDTDSIRLGEEAAYHLTVTYPRNTKIILPDSTYNYGEFELNHRRWYPTRIKNSMLFDSVVYYLATFDLDSVFHFQLPVFVVQRSDCVAYYPTPDSLILKQVITQMPDSLKLKADTRLIHNRALFNYPLWLLVAGILVVVIVLIVIFFGKRILKAYRIIMMRRKHRKFVEKFYLQLGKLRDSNSDRNPEHVLHYWKKYMETLEKEPYTKLTTRELVKLYNDAALTDNLKAIDRFIYGNIKGKPMHEYFSGLLDYTVNRFRIRMKEVQDGN